MRPGRRRTRRGQEAVTLVEFAIVAPLFMIFLFLILDFGKAIYVKNTLDSAAREAARTGVVLTSTYGTSGEPTATDMQTAAKDHSSDVSLPTNSSEYCSPHSAPTAGNSGLLYIDGGTAGDGGAPGGETATSVTCPNGTTVTLSPRSGHEALQATIVYCYKPLFPLLSSVLSLATSGNCKGGITMVSTSTMQTEY